MALGYPLGGTAGIGTALFAFGIGPIVRLTLLSFSHAAYPQREGPPAKDLECTSGCGSSITSGAQVGDPLGPCKGLHWHVLVTSFAYLRA